MQYAFGPTIGAGVNVTLITYQDTCALGINADSGAIPDLPLFRECLVAGFDEVLALGSETPPPSRPRQVDRRVPSAPPDRGRPPPEAGATMTQTDPIAQVRPRPRARAPRRPAARHRRRGRPRAAAAADAFRALDQEQVDAHRRGHGARRRARRRPSSRRWRSRRPASASSRTRSSRTTSPPSSSPTTCGTSARSA